MRNEMPKLPKLDSNKDMTFYVIGVAIVILIALIAVSLITYLIVSIVDFRQDGMDACMQNMGYSYEYCSYLAN